MSRTISFGSVFLISAVSSKEKRDGDGCFNAYYWTDSYWLMTTFYPGSEKWHRPKFYASPSQVQIMTREKEWKGMVRLLHIHPYVWSKCRRLPGPRCELTVWVHSTNKSGMVLRQHVLDGLQACPLLPPSLPYRQQPKKQRPGQRCSVKHPRQEVLP